MARGRATNTRIHGATNPPLRRIRRRDESSGSDESAALEEAMERVRVRVGRVGRRRTGSSSRRDERRGSCQSQGCRLLDADAVRSVCDALRALRAEGVTEGVGGDGTEGTGTELAPRPSPPPRLSPSSYPTTTLNLSSADVCGEGASFLASFLLDPLCALEELNLVDNPRVGVHLVETRVAAHATAHRADDPVADGGGCAALASALRSSACSPVDSASAGAAWTTPRERARLRARRPEQRVLASRRSTFAPTISDSRARPTWRRRWNDTGRALVTCRWRITPGVRATPSRNSPRFSRRNRRARLAGRDATRRRRTRGRASARVEGRGRRRDRRRVGARRAWRRRRRIGRVRERVHARRRGGARLRAPEAREAPDPSRTSPFAGTRARRTIARTIAPGYPRTPRNPSRARAPAKIS